MDEYLHYFNEIQLEQDPIFNPEMTRLAKTDANKPLNEAKRQIKIIQYTCNNTVAAEHEKVLLIKSPDPKEGPKRGPQRSIDIIESCPLICKVDVSGRKAPLRIHVEYENQVEDDKRPKTAKVAGERQNIKDLRVFASDKSKNPKENDCLQAFYNPGKGFTIRLPEVPEAQLQKMKAKDAKILREQFQCQYIYLSFNSVMSQSLNVCCSFP